MKLLIMMMFISAGLFAEDIHKEFTSAPGKRLEMHLSTGGSIEIEGIDGNKVIVDVSSRGRDDDDNKIEFEETAEGVIVTSHYSHWERNESGSLRFKVKVPKKYDLDLDSKGGGFTIAGVEGDLEGTTMGGALELTQLKGKVHFKTMGGEITLTKSEVDGEVKTNGGKVRLEDVVGNVSGHSMGGAVTYKNVTDRAGNGTGDVVKITTMGGEINVSDAPHGADLSTMGGDVEVHSAGSFVKAKTMGGNIKIGDINGEVQAETMGGDVDVTMTGNPAEGKRDVDLRSKGGDITLYVPAGLSMDVDISIAYTRNSHYDRKSFAIESDFDLTQDRTSDWDDE